MSLDQALKVAGEHGLDLAEVAPLANPPVCKVLDYGKYQYHQRKVETKHRKMQKKSEIKGIRLGFKTGDHDLEVKENQARKFIKERNAVKVALLFKGREAMYERLAIDKMNKFYEDLKDIVNLDTPPKRQGNTLLMILTPKQ